MSEDKSCGLTETEWEYLLNVFEEHLENSDDADEAYEILHEIHMKLFFMDHLIKQDMEKQNAKT